MKPLDRIERVVSRLEEAMLWLSALALVLAGLLVVFAVPSRELPAIALPDNVLFVQSLLLISIALGLGHTTGRGKHIRVDLAYNHFGRRTRAVARLVALVAGVFFFVPLAYWYGTLAWDFLQSGRSQSGTLRLPKWPPYAILSFGFWLVSARLILLIVRGAPEQPEQKPSEVR